MQEKIPKFLEEKLIKQYGENIVKTIINELNTERPVTLRINTIKTTRENVKEELDNNNIIYKDVEWNNDALIIENVKEDKIRELPIYENGEIYMQSLSSMLPPIILEPKQNENILDMASAPGGKTMQMSAISENKAMITACEKNKIRLERLKYNLQKQGATRVNVMQEDARNLSDFFSFDKILLDAPCSGSGTLNIISKNFSEELIQRSIKTQKELTQKAIKILKPGGELVYSTCSILQEENEEIIKQILKNSNIKIEPIQIHKTIPQLPTKIEGTIVVKPSSLYEGFFVAKLVKGK